MSLCLFLGLTNVQAADAFGLSTRAVANAKNDDSGCKEFGQLALPKIERDKMQLLRPLLEKYFATIEPVSGLCFVPHFSLCSLLGRTNPTFRGTSRGCFLDYQRFCRKMKAKPNEIVRTPRIFHRERLEANIGILAAYVLFAFIFGLILFHFHFLVINIPLQRLFN